MDILEQYMQVAPTILQAIDMDAMMAISDGKKFLAYFKGKKMVLDVEVGSPLPAGDPMITAFRTGRKQVVNVPEEVYGFPFKSVSTPIFEGNKVVGVFGFAVTIENDLRILKMFNSMNETMNGMQDEISAIHGHTEGIGSEVKKFADLLQSINENFDLMKNSAEGIKSIASQSNILSLNASIEAARAGEAGRGFAIVSKQMQEHSSSSRRASEEVLSVLNRLHKDVENVANNLEGLKSSFDQQSEAIDVMSSSLQSLHEMSDALLKYIDEN